MARHITRATGRLDVYKRQAKFFATAFRNAKMTEAVEKLINERDGLALGICNGFQALIKLCLLYTSVHDRSWK